MEYLGLGERLKTLRKSKALTQKQIAERIGIAVSTLSGYELEEKHPQYGILKKLAKLYGVSTDYLLGMEESRSIDVSELTDREISVLADMADLLKQKKKK